MEARLGMAYVDDLKICAHAYYVNEREAGLRSCERLLSKDHGGLVDEEHVRRQRTWYTPTLEAMLSAPVQINEIRVPPARPGWSTFNPTIAADDGWLLAIVRSSNYVVTPEGCYVTPPEDNGRIKTRNIVARMDVRGGVSSSMELLGPGYDTSDFPIEGMEDLRLFRGGKATGNAWMVSGTVCDVPDANGDRRIGVARLLPDAGVLCDFSCPEPPVPGRHEKNWQPLGGLTWLYANWEDGAVAKVSWSTTGWWMRKGEVSSPLIKPSPWIARGFRGGSQLVPWPSGGYVSCVHEVALIGGRRAYEHRLVRYDGLLNIVAITDPFVFKTRRWIEFCAGAAVIGGWLFLSYGDNDRTAWLACAHIGAVDKAWKGVA